MDKILIATTNLGKVDIYRQVFKELDIECLSLRDIDCRLDVEENGATEEENAIIKATAYHNATGLAVLCNDSGLIIDKLSKEDQPGVFVRRYNGKELTDKELLNVYIKKIKDIGGSSTGYFNVGLAIVDNKGILQSKTFQPKRYFITKASANIRKGCPLDSICIDDKTGKFLSDMTIEERNTYESVEMEKQKDFIKSCFDKKHNDTL